MSRKDLKNNILKREIIRIDFLKIENLEDKINKILPYMQKNGYNLSTNTTYDINIEINDPDPLITQDIITKKTTLSKINYNFQKDDINYTINEYMIIFCKTNFNNYKGVDNYIGMLSYILQELVKQEAITYQRVGIRKINSILLKKKSDVNKLFRNFNNLQIDKDAQVNINNVKTVQSEQINYNLLTAMSNGMATIKNIEIEANQIIIDIDFYKRKFEKMSYKELIDDIKLLNEELHSIFEKELTEQFIELLKKEDIQEELNKIGILEGVNKCQI